MNKQMKTRSTFGKWLDSQGIKQEDFMKKSDLSRSTMSKLCNDKEYIPCTKVMQKVLHTVQEIDSRKKITDLFKI
ncbi:helix-turn-helix domain-containing protein [Bacillus spongiae]|uniref:Helix-turn-helix domain-containing protein n=1 Tax=Bacillus spongiae TaxID=2683610 RepID=A0ABU8HAM2_9BACI